MYFSISFCTNCLAKIVTLDNSFQVFKITFLDKDKPSQSAYIVVLYCVYIKISYSWLTCLDICFGLWMSPKNDIQIEFKYQMLYLIQTFSEQIVSKKKDESVCCCVESTMNDIKFMHMIICVYTNKQLYLNIREAPPLYFHKKRNSS